MEAVGIHGGKDQEEREYAIQMFKEGKKVPRQLGAHVTFSHIYSPVEMMLGCYWCVRAVTVVAQLLH